ncbi:hypothetical protein [Halalkalibacter hemicellulosilyticus]|uniref:Uncharacterized protein n=1 Tax=Halalkalibacter hemicellulosilyticusJCM 9152 TaxID=1236971 RepID=W4QG07_9BACI|nr:hypothetical protein [Halalkalibacter hemicellulosilyticus]GAE30583.1 hypothetical protein JCM9152_1995 [Halalkalibacter hemicellulosilyticusJCM 9152]
MGWALLLIFIVAIILLCWSLFSKEQSAEKKQMEQFSVSVMQEVDHLQQQIRDLELDQDIIAQEAKVPSKTSQERKVLRELLDLHRRGYSMEGIAHEKGLTENEVILLLTPYIEVKQERRQAANDS